MKKIMFFLPFSIIAAAVAAREITLRQAFELMVARNNSRLGRMLVSEKNMSPRPIHDEWLADADVRKVSVVSHDGLRLAGHFIIVPDAERNVLMMHGWRGIWKDCAGPAQELVREKCNVLIIEERAQGNSEGKYMGFGIQESEDCRTWYRFIHKNNPLPIYLMGESMGAATVMMAAGRKLPPYVRGIIADCGFTTPYDIVRKVILGHEGGNDRLVHLMEKRCIKRAGYSLKAASATEAMRKCTVPVFFAHGTSDSFVPHGMSVANYRACASKKELYLVDGADHCGCFEKNPKEYINRIKTFFEWDNRKRG